MNEYEMLQVVEGMELNERYIYKMLAITYKTRSVSRFEYYLSYNQSKI